MPKIRKSEILGRDNWCFSRQLFVLDQGTSEASGFQRKMSEEEKFELIESNSNSYNGCTAFLCLPKIY